MLRYSPCIDAMDSEWKSDTWHKVPAYKKEMPLVSTYHKKSCKQEFWVNSSQTFLKVKLNSIKMRWDIFEVILTYAF